MKTGHVQILENWDLRPFGDESYVAVKHYHINQILSIKMYGAEKPRSLIQLNLYWNRCEYVAQMKSDHEHQYTKEDIDFEVKVQVAKQHPSMIRRYKMVNGIVYMELISIAFMNMKHLEACKYFDFAFPIMGQMIGITADELLRNER